MGVGGSEGESGGRRGGDGRGSGFLRNLEVKVNQWWVVVVGGVMKGFPGHSD